MAVTEIKASSGAAEQTTHPSASHNQELYYLVLAA
jgi:hypothetical protein